MIILNGYFKGLTRHHKSSSPNNQVGPTVHAMLRLVGKPCSQNLNCDRRVGLFSVCQGQENRDEHVVVGNDRYSAGQRGVKQKTSKNIQTDMDHHKGYCKPA